MWKLIGLLLSAAALVAAGQGDSQRPSSSSPVAQEPEQGHRDTLFNQRRANMNDYMDYVMSGVGDWMRTGGVTPFDLPDLREGFSYKPLLIEYSGWVDLYHGVLHDIDQVYRSGDSFMSYDRLLLGIEVDAALTSITFTYDYTTTIMSLGLFEGSVEGSADNIVIHCNFLVDMYDFYIFMQDFEVRSIGNIDVRLRGNLLTDWIGNIMIDLITFLFKGTITEMVSDRVKVFVQQTLDKINANRSFSGDALEGPMAPLAEVLRAAIQKHSGGQLPSVATGIRELRLDNA